MRRGLLRFIPETGAISLRERLRSASGALLGVLLTGLCGWLMLRAGPSLPTLIAPMGASAVLLFAVPASPLAQPWSILGGNTVASLVGVTAAMLFTDPFVACAVAIGLSILIMMSLHCLHPPSGAVALTAVLGGPAIHDLGYGFVLWPVAGNSLALLVVALVFNNLTGRAYPHSMKTVPATHGTSDPPPAERFGFSSADLDEVLKEYDQFIDIDRDDLELILRRTELRSWRKRSGHMDCSAAMSRDVIAISPDASLKEAQQLLREHHIKALPVTDDNAQVVGIVTQTDILDKALWDRGVPRIGFRRRLQLALSGAPAPNGTVKDIMTSPVRTVTPDTWLSAAIVIFAEEGLHYLPVVSDRKRLVGIISQSDVLVAMIAGEV